MRSLITTAMAAILLLAQAGARAAVEGPLVQRSVSAAREGRFIGAGTGQGFLAVAPGRRLDFGAAGVSVQFPGVAGKAASGVRSTGAGLSYRFEGGAAVAPEGIGLSPTLYHWLVGPRSEWQTGLRSYDSVAYRQVWPGIDAIFAGDRAGFKYRFELAQGADPARVHMVVEGVDSAELRPDGSLLWRQGTQQLVDAAPVSFQTVGGQARSVATRYQLDDLGGGRWRVGFVLGAYDTALPLVIDPAWIGYSGLIGGSAQDQVHAVTLDTDGNTYACGVTRSAGLPKASNGYVGGDDAFLVKFDSSGTAQLVTYFGGSGDEVCTGLAVDDQKRIYLTGGTDSSNFPVQGNDSNNRFRRTLAGGRDAFVMRLPAGASSIDYSGFIGGSESDQGNGIAVDGSYRAYVTGYSQCTAVAGGGCVTAGLPGTAFPTLGGPRLSQYGGASGSQGYDAFVAAVAADGSGLLYAGFLGGDGDTDIGNAIVAASDGTVYVAGQTDSTDASLPTRSILRSSTNDRASDASDGFVARISSVGTLGFFSLLTGQGAQSGKSGADRALAVALDGQGGVVVGGETDSTGFPQISGGSSASPGPLASSRGGMDGFVLRLDSSGTAITSVSYVGASGYDAVQAVASDGSAFYFTGPSNPGNNFNFVDDKGLSQVALGAQDVMLGKVLYSAPSAWKYAGLLGGSGMDDARSLVAATTVDGSVLRLGGTTSGTSAPAGAAASQSNNSSALAGYGGASGMVLRIDPFGPPASLVKTGDNQSTPILSGFSTALTVQVLDASGQPLRNVQVSFTVPGSGASALLTPSSSVSTDSNGNAAVTAIANGTAGSYSVQASAGGISVSFSLSNSKGTQNTLLPSLAPNPVAYGSTGTLSSAGGSGSGALSFAVTVGGTNCSVSGTTLTATEVGTCTVTVSKAGDANYNAASATLDVSTTTADQVGFGVGASPASIPLNSDSTLSSSGGSGSGAVSYAITNGGSFCSLTGSTVSGIAVGTCTVTATKAGDSHYKPAQATVDISVTRAAQTVLSVSASPAALSYGGTATLSISGGSGGGAVSYAVTAGGSYCSVSGTDLTATGVGTCTITATKAGDASYLDASATVDVVVSKASQSSLSVSASPAALSYGGSATLSASGGSGAGAVSFAVTAGASFCSVSGSSLSAIGVGTCTVTATKAADSTYEATSATVDVVVSPAAQSTFSLGMSPTSLVLQGTATLSTQGGSGSGAVSFVVSNGNSFCSVSGSTVTGTGVGTCTVTATKAADSQYSAVQATLDIAVGKMAQSALSVTATPASLSYGGTASLSTTGGSGDGVVSYAITAGDTYCSVSGSTLSATGVGTCTVTATKAADATHASISATVDVVVGAAAQAGFTVSAAPLAPVYGGSATLSSSGGSGSGAVSYAVTAGNTFCSVSGSTLSAIGVGTCTVTATKAASGPYLAATATVDVTVGRAAQTSLSLQLSPATLVLHGSVTLSAGGGSGSGAVSFVLQSGQAFCTLSGNTLSAQAIGDCSVTVSKAGDTLYQPATASLVISVGKASQSISFSSLTDRVLGTADFTLGASASSGLEVSYVSLTPGLCQVSGNRVHLTVAGQCTLSARQAGDANYSAAAAVEQSFTITLPAGTSTSLSGMPGGGSVSLSGGWVFAPPGSGNGATAGFIPLTGHPKSPNVAPPPGLTFPYGLFDFVVMNGAPGGTVVLTFELPVALPPNAQYWKFGPTPGNTVPHWYQFSGVQFNGKTATLTIVDGGLGDDDLTADGAISDGGGIAVPDPSALVDAVPTLDSWALGALALGLLLAGGLGARRRRD